ncbi:DUF4129 domain-containing protein [Halalkalicoccus subterraneus]|uniref:DUF4129 domain-containing protein n=1 Tax=Halalkalicoccus subterraneus TaxID=2675002 RepID=UPI000EFCA0FE|nr:DUF4129 domain-containing protein [Halalkalicoccus subterraneus]
MNDATRSALIAALALLAVAFAAATLGSTVTTEDGSPGSGDGIGGGEGGGGPLPPPEPGSPGETIVVPYLTELLTVLAVLASLVLLVYAFLHRREALALLVALALLLALIYLLFELVADLGGEFSPPLDPGSRSPFGGGSGGDGAAGDSTGPSTPSVLSGVVLVLAVVGGLIALVGRSSDAEPEPEKTGSGPDADAAAVGRAAGRAADRVASRETEHGNEVYRAWREMTGLLDASDSEARTPREFADRAVAAGLAEKDVEELTRLFEDVRYGERAASEEYEHRAVETFRRIERRYAEDER